MKSVVRTLYLLWLIGMLCGTLWPEARLWGLHLPEYLPLWGEILFFGLSLTVLLIPWEKVVGLLHERFSFSTSRFPYFILFFLMLFVLAAPQVSLLGDGKLRSGEAVIGAIRPIEYLSSLLITQVYSLGAEFFSWTGRQAVTATSILAGLLALILLSIFTRRIWDDPKSRFLARIWVIASGLTVLFCGYIESYAIPAAFILGFLLTAEANRRGRCPIYLPAAFFLLAVFSHIAAVLLLPALIVLTLNQATRQLTRIATLVVTTLVSSLWCVYALFTGPFSAETPAGSILLSIHPTDASPYGLLSLSHTVDLLNLLCLVCPGLIIAFPILWATRKKKSDAPGRWFWPLAIMIPLALPLFIDPKLGMPRDWDLFTLGMIPLIVWSAARVADTRPTLTVGALTRPLFASLVTVFLFLAINANTSSAISRFKALLALDEYRGSYGHEILAMTYHHLGQTSFEIEQYQLAIHQRPLPRYWTKLREAYVKMSDYPSALSAAREVYRLQSSSADAAYHLGMIHRLLNQEDSAQAYLRQAAKLRPTR